MQVPPFQHCLHDECRNMIQAFAFGHLGAREQEDQEGSRGLDMGQVNDATQCIS